MNIKTILFLLLIVPRVFSQVGIGTTTPQEDLHIDGTLQVTGGIRLGGDGQANGAGTFGANGQVITSDGSGNSIWQTPTPPQSLAGFFVPVIITHLQNNFDDNTFNLVMTSNDNISGDLVEDVDSDNLFDPTTGVFTVSTQALYRIRFSINYTTSDGASLTTTLGALPYLILGIWDNTNNKAAAEFYVTPDYNYTFSTTDAGVASSFESFATLSPGNSYLFNAGAIIDTSSNPNQRFRFLADDGTFNGADNPTFFITLERVNN